MAGKKTETADIEPRVLTSFTRAKNIKEKLFERVPTFPRRGGRDLETPRHVHSPRTLVGGTTLRTLQPVSIERDEG